MAKKTGLGRGLDALFSDTIKEPEIEEVTGEIVQNIKITKIEPDKEQPRKRFDEEKLDELANSIKQYGVIQPIIVTLKDDYYQIIAGERRWRAAKKAGLTEIPCLVRTKTEQENREIALIENIQRENLNPIEEANSYVMLMEVYGYTQENLASKLGKTRSAISNKIRLLKLPDKVKNMVKEGVLSYGHARAILSITDEKTIEELSEKIINKKYSVREVENLVKKYNGKSNNQVKNKNKNEIMIDSNTETDEDKYEKNFLEQKLIDFFESRVNIKGNIKNQGKIEIDFYDYEDLRRIIDLLEINFD